jgi:hypothetical protein
MKGDARTLRTERDLALFIRATKAIQLQTLKCSPRNRLADAVESDEGDRAGLEDEANAARWTFADVAARKDPDILGADESGIELRDLELRQRDEA